MTARTCLYVTKMLYHGNLGPSRFQVEVKMNDQSVKSDRAREKRLTFILHFSWITFVAVMALLMRVIVGQSEIIEDLEEFEETETQQISLDRRLPATLKPMTETASSTLASNRVYLPFYRTLYVEEDRAVNNLYATLSIHNTSSEHELVLDRLTYFDGAGEMISEPLSESHVLAPMASAEFYVGPQQPETAETAAAMVMWSGEASISPPLVEAIIVGKYGAKGFSVISRGVSLP